MACLLDPSSWAGLFTLVVVELVLGIDNLIFISILAEKLPFCQRDKARLTGLALSFLMRLGLLSLISWMVSLTTPILFVYSFHLSIHDLILLSGGMFLLFKATLELHERLENKFSSKKNNKNYSNFWLVISQIVTLDTIFSLDSVITAAGIANQLSIMVMALAIAMTLMFLASKILTTFINSNPTVVVLCLSFLLMIGFSLVVQACGFIIPKGYLYVAIMFSILIETFNQIARRNLIKHQSQVPIKKRAAQVISKLVTKHNTHPLKKTSLNENVYIQNPDTESEDFKDEEKYMLNSILTLSGRSIRSIMTPRREISWININQKQSEIRKQLLNSPHSLFPVCKGEIDEIIGIVRAKELLIALDQNVDIFHFASQTPPIIIPDTLDPINLISILRKSKGNFVTVTNEFGAVQGLITPLDVLEAIAGEFPDADETPDIILENDGWLVKGGTDLHSLEQLLHTNKLIKNKKNYASLAGFLISQKGKLPLPGDKIKIPPLNFYIIKATEYRIDLVKITKDKIHEQRNTIN